MEELRFPIPCSNRYLVVSREGENVKFSKIEIPLYSSIGDKGINLGEISKEKALEILKNMKNNLRGAYNLEINKIEKALEMAM